MLYAQNIFIPDENKLNAFIRSITSFSEYIKKNPYNVDVYIGGYVAKDEHWNKINATIKDYPYNITRFDKNYGKAYVTNAIVKKALETKKYEHLLLSDYDIVFMKEEKHFFERLLEAARYTSHHRKLQLGMIGINQSEKQCHAISSLNQNVFKYTNQYGEEETILWNNYPGYIGGGCIFTSIEIWNIVGGYRVMGVYAGEDAYYLIDMKNNHRSWQLMESLHILHPHDTDTEYYNFKCGICAKITNGTNRVNNLDTYINQMSDFWSKR